MSSSAVADLLRDLDRVMRSLDAKWYLFGAQAVVVWGRPRLSAEVDLTVELIPEHVRRFVTEMSATGFALRVRDVDQLG